MVKIKIGDVEATIENYEWSSKDKRLEKMLNARLDPDGPSGADPYPDLTAAQEAVDSLGGEIVKYDKPPDYPEDMVF